jgi:hypothetical protein
MGLLRVFIVRVEQMRPGKLICKLELKSRPPITQQLLIHSNYSDNQRVFKAVVLNLNFISLHCSITGYMRESPSAARQEGPIIQRSMIEKEYCN